MLLDIIPTGWVVMLVVVAVVWRFVDVHLRPARVPRGLRRRPDHGRIQALERDVGIPVLPEIVRREIAVTLRPAHDCYKLLGPANDPDRWYARCSCGAVYRTCRPGYDWRWVRLGVLRRWWYRVPQMVEGDSR